MPPRFKSLFRRLLQASHIVFAFVFLSLLVGTAKAYDNSTFPPFTLEKSKRGYSWLSIHPDGERWLITECTDRIAPPKHSCYLFLYNLKTRAYQRYDMPPGYVHTEASFSPRGDWIVAIRRPQLFGATDKESLDAYGQGEVLMMRVDGSGFRVLPAPRGPVKRPAISPDGKKLAYWEWNRTASPERRVRFIDNDLRELDLETGADRLFAGDYKFLVAHSLQYLTDNDLLIGAETPTADGMTPFKYYRKYGSSQLYLIQRGTTDIPPPAFWKIPSVSVGSADKNLHIYVLADHKETGNSIVEFHSQQELRHWRAPNFGENTIVALSASPDGSHLGFIYPASPIGSPERRSGIGMFDIKKEHWAPLSLPFPELASAIFIKGEKK